MASRITRSVVALATGALLAFGVEAAVPTAHAAATVAVPVEAALVGGIGAPNALAAPGARAVSLTIKSPVGKCRKKKKVIIAPSDRDQFCTYRLSLIGHAYPAPKASGYLQRVAGSLSKGEVVRYQGKLYKVAWKKSIKKKKLPNAYFAKKGTTRYLVTCDTKSGYRAHHSLANLVVKFVRV
ncbi:MAG TPA: hypothetical protein PKV13_04935 [Propionicimonas sp.]|nr:hypothetical protein [Propionicimonas sp.]